jgi:hypothetical protein
MLPTIDNLFGKLRNETAGCSNMENQLVMKTLKELSHYFLQCMASQISKSVITWLLSLVILKDNVHNNNNNNNPHKL